jgi:hypothetical protein
MSWLGNTVMHGCIFVPLGEHDQGLSLPLPGDRVSELRRSIVDRTSRPRAGASLSRTVYSCTGRPVWLSRSESELIKICAKMS